MFPEFAISVYILDDTIIICLQLIVYGNCTGRMAMLTPRYPEMVTTRPVILDAIAKPGAVVHTHR